MTRDELLKKYFDNYVFLNNLDYQKQISKIAYCLNTEDQKKILPIIKVDDDKVILISDTHLGSLNENYHYIDLVYNFAIENNINVILHAGDFMQGTVKPVLSSCQIIENQINYVINNYPMDKSIKNYVLIGNHDYFVFRKSDNIISHFSERNDIEFLGYKKVYINWHNYLISLSHYLSKYKIDVPRIETLLKFAGHRHELYFDGSTIHLPTLSDDIKYYGNNYNNYPGFIYAKINDEITSVYNLNIINNTIKYKKLILEKKLNERVKVE